VELNDLIESISIVDFISQYVDLEEKNGEYWGISPFTYPPENTPSFSVREENGSFYDFSSGIGGNVFTFVKQYNHCSSMEAVNILEGYAGFDSGSTISSQRLSATLVCKKFSQKKSKTRSKASKVTIYPDDYMERFELREDKLAVWEAEGIRKSSLIQ